MSSGRFGSSSAFSPSRGRGSLHFVMFNVVHLCFPFMLLVLLCLGLVVHSSFDAAVGGPCHLTVYEACTKFEVCMADLDDVYRDLVWHAAECL